MPKLKNLVTDSELVRVVHIGLCFTVLFSADFTLNYMQKSVTTSITEDEPGFQVDGYTTLATVYTVYGLSLWLAPCLLAATGPRLCLVLGSLTYILHPVSLLTEKIWVTFAALVVSGVGGSLLWVAHGNYMVRTSSHSTVSRNFGVFWALFSAAMIPGNIYAAVTLQGKDKIDRDTRQRLLVVLGAVASVATALFVFLRSPAPSASVLDTTASHHTDPPPRGPLSALSTTWKIFWSRSMLLLLVTFIYTGFQQAFGSGVLGPSVGFTRELGERRKQLIPVSGLCYGLGEITGGLLHIISNRVMSSLKQLPVAAVISAFCLQSLAYLLVLLALPDRAVFGETSDPALLPPRWSMVAVLGAAVLLGLGDSLLNTQIYPLLAALRPADSAHTAALYKFTKSMAMAVFFVSSTRVGLQTQAGVLCGSGLLGVLGFLVVERWSRLNTGSYSYSSTLTPHRCSSRAAVAAAVEDT